MNRRELLASAGVTSAGVASLGAIPKTTVARERQSSDTYRNPVYEHVFPDPDVLRVDGTYYAYATYHDWGRGPERELVPIVRSPNLVDWTFVGPAFREMPDWSKYRSLWAPGVGRFDGRVLLYFSDAEFAVKDEGIGVATAEDPAGPFAPRGGILRSQAIGVANSIDPMLFVRESPYLFWGSKQGLYGIRLADDGLAIAGEKFQIAGDGVEAPYVVEREGYFYLFGSRGLCCEGAKSDYRVVVGRAEDLRGPYRNRAGERLTAPDATGTTILESGDRFAGPGHCAVVRDENDGWWMLYHAYERGQGWIRETPRRVLMLDRIRWVDGWPVVGENGTPSETGPVPPIRG